MRYEDVAGNEEAKGELKEVVRFLKDPDKFSKLGAAVPKAYPITAPIPPQVAADAGPNKIQAPRADAVKLAVNVKVFSSLFPTI